ncbi:MAG: glycosyltransferase family 4 protein [Candidatus Zixiibacteriota bacterium]
MRILAVNWQDVTNPLGGGAEVHIEEILKRVASWGHSVTLACSNYPNGREREERDGLVIRRRGSRQNFNFVTPGLVKEILREAEYDLIVEDINKIPFYLPLWQKRPHLAVIPHLFGKNIYQEANAIVASYVYFAEKPIPRVYRHSRFLAISNSTRDDLVSRGIERENIDVAECGVDHSIYKVDSATQRYSEPTILYLGRLKKYKSVHHVIAAMPQIRKSVAKARLLIVGSGDHLNELKALAEKLALGDCVEFVGFVSEKEKLEYLRRSHVSVYPSPKEGWGITNIEANACGTPVVAANSPGLRDSVSDGKSGLLYEYGDVDQLSSQIVKLLSDQTKHECMSKSAVEWAQRFTWDDCAQRSFAAMERTVAEWGRRG